MIFHLPKSGTAALNIEFVREKGKDQINGQLCEEIDQYQRSEQRIGDPVQIMECQKQKWREVADNGHGQVGRVACQL